MDHFRDDGVASAKSGQTSIDRQIDASDVGGFVGREALKKIKENGRLRKLVGFRLDTRKIGRNGMEIFQGERSIGKITSGIPSPTLGYPIAMALISADVKEPEGIEVDIRGKRFAAIPETLPFFSNTRKKSTKTL